MSIIQDKPVKITDEELQELKQLQQNKQDLIFALGELEYEKSNPHRVNCATRGTWKPNVYRTLIVEHRLGRWRIERCLCRCASFSATTCRRLLPAGQSSFVVAAKGAECASVANGAAWKRRIPDARPCSEPHV